MNRPCEQCGRIITVPDIPLPPTYRQKCTACGYSNHVGRDLDLDQLSSGRAPSPPGWDATFDKTLDGIDNPKASEPLEALQDHSLRLPDKEPEPAASSFLKPQLGHRLVLPGQLVMGTRNTLMYQKCHGIFFKQGSHMKGVNDVEKLYELLVETYFQVIVLDQQFLTGDGGRLVFQYIKETPIAIRRAQTVVLITPSIPTAEPQVFYQWGIDLNIHPRDLDKIGVLVHQVIHLKDLLLNSLTAT